MESTGGIGGRLGVGYQEVDAVMICLSADGLCSAARRIHEGLYATTLNAIVRSV
jgi:hypothetical protein